jgi:NAD(P)-dependent dehydrogenase (short-subunit alcohol dehydrogenase family)
MVAKTVEIKPDVLVVGAAEGSLGEAIVNEMRKGPWEFGRVTTAGIGGEEVKLNLLHVYRAGQELDRLMPDIVVCTAGINKPADIGSARLRVGLMDSLAHNVLGPMMLLQEFVVSEVRPERADMVKRFVAISSNSAHIPRRGSMPYCASKAALSMALRVAARELANRVAVWGYEPGLLAGTPMSEQTRRDFGTDEPLHRMPGVGPEGIPVADLAQQIVQDISTFSVAHNGLMIPFDAGEL